MSSPSATLILSPFFAGGATPKPILLEKYFIATFKSHQRRVRDESGAVTSRRNDHALVSLFGLEALMQAWRVKIGPSSAYRAGKCHHTGPMDL